MVPQLRQFQTTISFLAKNRPELLREMLTAWGGLLKIADVSEVDAD